MKKRLYAILALVLTISTVMTNVSVVSLAEPDDDVVFDEDKDIALGASLENSTGTQQDAMAEVVDVDEDIKDDILSAVGKWQEIHIKSADDLLDLAKDCRLDTFSRNKMVYLDNDIDLLGIEFGGFATFGGIFDGQGHKLFNVNIYYGESFLGLFSRIQKDGVIKDLDVSGRLIPSGKQNVLGGLCGDNEGIISNCSFNGVVEGNDYVGGLVGINELTGIIIDCKSEGYVSGEHFTGGIAGENMGNIIRSTNMAVVNITNKDSSVSATDIDINSLKAMISSEYSDKGDTEATAMINGISDTGGIAGVSIGVIQYCVNEGDVGYEAVGYNVGGIAGRQSGYIYSCVNNAKILGRKDVGGIVGQAEPYITIDFANDVTQQLSENIEKLHDIISVTLNDADSKSDAISARLSIIQAFTDNALQDTKYLEEATIDWTNGMISSSNEALSRIDYILDETAKKDGVLDEVGYAAKNSSKAASEFIKTVNDLDVYKYMSGEEQTEYDNARTTLNEAVEEHAKYVDEVYEAYVNYYIDYYKYTDEYNGTSTPSTGTTNETHLAFKDDLGSYQISSAVDSGTQPASSMSAADVKTNYGSLNGKWVHKDLKTSGTDESFPYADDEDQKELDKKLIKKAEDKAADSSKIYANDKYYSEHGRSYTGTIDDCTSTMMGIIYNHSDEMSSQTIEDASSALGYVSDAADNLADAGKKGKDIVDNINSREDIVLPTLSDDYKKHATSLTNNLQGMSDNFGCLNNEMNGASDVMIKDLSAVNDQFNTIMLLFTDAIDGALDNDYSDNYEDNSMEVAEFTTDATVDACINNGYVDGSLNAAGIAGTMAIEYEYDLESDVTGIKDAAMNRTYLTKCVLRNNVNKAEVIVRKNYVGGICGLQEMGTIIGCENYAKISSDTSSYVGGVSGCSYSNIVRSYAKCSLYGTSYVGGIAGDATNIYECLSLVNIPDATEWYGAVAGHVADDGIIRQNYFIGDTLAGIDRVSYSKKAEPIEYKDAMLIEGVPEYFNKLYITFMLSDDVNDEGEEIITKLGQESYNYGEFIAEFEYPEVPEKDGYYVVWDISAIPSLEYDDVVIAKYVRNKNTLAGATLRDEKQSAILVDGSFEEEDELFDTLCIGETDELKDCYEYWDLVIPYDGAKEHQIRYAKTEDMKNDPRFYYLDGSSWVEISEENIGSMGSYKTFELPGNNIRLQVIYSGRKYEILYKILIVAGIIAGIVLVLFIIVLIRANRTRVKRKVRKMVKQNIENIQTKDPAIKFATPDDVANEEDDKV